RQSRSRAHARGASSIPPGCFVPKDNRQARRRPSFWGSGGAQGNAARAGEDAMKRSIWLALTVFALSVLCGNAGAQTLQPVKIGVVRLTGSIPLYVAVDKGFFHEEGLDTQLVWFEASAAIPVAIASGDIDFGSAAFTGALFNIGAKGGLKMIASQL